MAQSLQIDNIRYRHKAIADSMIAEPDKKQRVLAVELDISETHLSVIVNSDAFEEYFALRRADHEERISEDIIAKFGHLAEECVDTLIERIQDERDTVGLGVVVDATKVAVSALGLGGGPRHGVGPVGGPTVNLFVGAVDQALLAQARAKMRKEGELSNITVIDHEDVKRMPGSG